jgi:hypothetical protein
MVLNLAELLDPCESICLNQRYAGLTLPELTIANPAVLTGRVCVIGTAKSRKWNCNPGNCGFSANESRLHISCFAFPVRRALDIEVDQAML